MTSLTNHQQFNFYRNTFNLFHNFIIAAKSSRDTPFTSSELEAALKSLTKQRLLLRCDVNSKTFTLKELKDINITDCYEAIPTREEPDGERAALQKLLMDIHENYKFPIGVDRPLWKIFTYKKWIIIALDHTLYDGTTGAAILNDLVLLLEGKKVEPEEDVKSINTKYEALLNVSYWEIGKVAFNMVVKPLLPQYIQDYLDFSKYYNRSDWFKVDGQDVKTQTFKSLNKLISIPYSRIEKTLKVLKVKQIGFQTLLNYATVKGFNQLTSDKSIKILIPLNMRKFIDVTPLTYGLFVGQVTIPVTPQSCNFKSATEPDWSLLYHLESSLSCSKQEQSKSLIAALGYIPIGEFLQSKANLSKADHHTTIEFSTLRAGKNKWVDEWVFSQTADDFLTLFPCSVISNDKVTNIMMAGHLASAQNGVFDKLCVVFEKNLNEIIDYFDGIKV